MRRLVRPALLIAVAAALAATLSACIAVKPGTFQITQPGGIGPIHYLATLCTLGSEPGSEPCEPNDLEGDAQQMLALLVPKGAAAPAAVAAAPGPGAYPIAFSRNQEVAEEFAAAIPPSEEEPWPPAGSEIVGYLSDVVQEKAGPEVEWTIDVPIGLPSGSDGGSFGGPVKGGLMMGWRVVDGTHPADRPIECFEGEIPDFTTVCEFPSEPLEAGVSDLKIPAAAAVKANVGATAAIPFTLDFSSSATARPTFDLSASTNLPGTGVTVNGSPFAPGAPPAGATRYAPATGTASLTVPAKAKPGAYEVTLTAKAAGGAAVSQTAQLTVVKPKIGLGKLAFDKKKGTATLQVKVFEAGTLTASGKGIAKVKKKAAKAKTLKVTIRAKGKAKKALGETGKAKVKAQLKFKPLAGAAVAKTRPITLQKSL